MDYNIWVGIIIYACTRHAVSQQLMVYVVCSKVQQMCPGPAHYRVLQSPWACRIARLSLSSRFSHTHMYRCMTLYICGQSITDLDIVQQANLIACGHTLGSDYLEGF